MTSLGGLGFILGQIVQCKLKQKTLFWATLMWVIDSQTNRQIGATFIYPELLTQEVTL